MLHVRADIKPIGSSAELRFQTPTSPRISALPSILRTWRLWVSSGRLPGDEGDRTYGIFNVIPKSGFSRIIKPSSTSRGEISARTNDYLSVAGHTNDFAYYASVEGNRSDLGLQTLSPGDP